VERRQVTIDVVEPTRPPAGEPPVDRAGADFDQICRDLFPRLAGAMALYTGDRALGEELAQEALARLWSRRQPLPSSEATPWCFRVATNLANSWFRRVAVARRAHARLGAPEASPPGAPEDRLAVLEAVAGLPRRQRQAVVLRYFAGFDTREAAQAMGCAEGTVRALVSQAFDGLRGALGDEAPVPEERSDG